MVNITWRNVVLFYITNYTVKGNRGSLLSLYETREPYSMWPFLLLMLILPDFRITNSTLSNLERKQSIALFSSFVYHSNFVAPTSTAVLRSLLFGEWIPARSSKSASNSFKLPYWFRGFPRRARDSRSSLSTWTEIGFIVLCQPGG